MNQRRHGWEEYLAKCVVGSDMQPAKCGRLENQQVSIKGKNPQISENAYIFQWSAVTPFP